MWDFSESVSVSLVIYGKDVFQTVGSRQSPDVPISEKHFSSLQNMGVGYGNIICKQCQQKLSCVSSTIKCSSILGTHISSWKQYLFLNHHTFVWIFWGFIVQIQFHYSDSYSLSACKAEEIKQSFLSRIFHEHHWRISLKADGIMWPMERSLWM